MIRSIRAEHKFTENPLQDSYLLHTHEQYELVYLVHGDADFVAEGNTYQLKKGDLVITSKLEAHFLNLTTEAYYERLMVVFDLEDVGDNEVDAAWIALLADKPLGERNRFPAAMFSDRHWHYYMDRICSCTDRSKQEAYLRIMLLELSEAYETVKTAPSSTCPSRATAIISYINQHLFENLSLDMLCSQFFLSKSQLNRIFKQATGSTVWNYIMIKRLLRAKELLRNGEGPMTVCEKCGFKNYVSFYKAYQNAFDHPPKTDYRQKENDKETARQHPE